MSVYTYPACFFEEEDGGYTVIFQDSLYGAATQGKNIGDSMKMAMDCLALVLDDFIEEGKKPPEPEELDMKKVMKGLGLEDEEYKGFINYVSVDYESYSKEHFRKSVKKTLSIPQLLDKKAKELGLNFSQILQEALEKEIKKKEKKKEKAMKKVG